MKKLIYTLSALSLLATAPALAGGSSYDCQSADRKVFFSGHDEESVVATYIISKSLTTQDGRDLGLQMEEPMQMQIMAKKMPDFGTPQDSNLTVKSVLAGLLKSFPKNSSEVSSKDLMFAVGKPTMILSEVEDVGRELGHMVFKQNFARVTVTHTPKFKQPDGSYFRVSTTEQEFLCESSYATACGGNCNAGDE